MTKSTEYSKARYAKAARIIPKITLDVGLAVDLAIIESYRHEGVTATIRGLIREESERISESHRGEGHAHLPHLR